MRKYFHGLGQPRKYFTNETLYALVEKMEDYKRALCVRGFHVYCDVWEVAIGEVLFSFLEMNLAAAATPCCEAMSARSPGLYRWYAPRFPFSLT